MAYETQHDATALVVTSTRTGKRSRFEEAWRLAHPAVAPDGRFAVVVSERERGVNLWRFDLQGGLISGEPVRLTDQPRKCALPRLSPDGRWVAYYRTLNDERDIWVMPIAGGASIRLTGPPSIDVDPEWSPDGSSLAYVSERESRSELRLAAFRDGSIGESRRVLTSQRPIMRLAWLKDAHHLAFVGIGDGGTWDVWVVPVSGVGSPTRLTRGADASVLHADPAREGLLVLGRWGGADSVLRAVSYPEGHVSEPNGRPAVTAGWSLAFFDVAASGDVWAQVETRIQGDIWLLEANRGRF